MKRLPRSGLLPVLLLLCMALPDVSALATESAGERLQALLADIRTLSANVTQLIVESDGAVLEESSIRMYLKKPDGFYWETLEPFPELIVTNGIKLWNYQPDLEQVVVEDWDSDNSELAAQLLSGRTEGLDSEYDISLSPASTETDLEFALTPRVADSIYREISINFRNRELDQIYLYNKSGEQTVWRFADLNRNQALADSLFEFEPPAGIEIIENSYVQ